MFSAEVHEYESIQSVGVIVHFPFQSANYITHHPFARFAHTNVCVLGTPQHSQPTVQYEPRFLGHCFRLVSVHILCLRRKKVMCFFQNFFICQLAKKKKSIQTHSCELQNVK